MVDRELRVSFDDLLEREVVEHDITLTCVSNTIGGELIGNARWTGVRLDDLLAEAGVDPAATQVVGRSDRRLHVRLPGRGSDRRPQRTRCLRHERRAAAARARVPGATDRARPLRLRLGHQVAHRDRADHVRGLRAVLGAPRLRRPGADQADEPDRLDRRARHADPQRRTAPPRSAASPGRRPAGSAPSRCSSTTAPGSRANSARRSTTTRGANGRSGGHRERRVGHRFAAGQSTETE